MIERLLAALCAVPVLFAAVASPASADDEPKWLQEARAREAKLPAPKEVRSKNGFFTANIPGKLARPIVLEDGSYSVHVDIGNGALVQCELIPDGTDLADTLKLGLELATKDIEQRVGKIESRQVERIDAGNIDHVPYITTAWLFLVNDGKTRQVSAVEQFVFDKNGHGGYCMHNDVGYTQTFASISRAFASTLSTKSGEPLPFYSEISVAKLGALKVGVIVTTLTRDKDGDVDFNEKSAMVMPKGTSTVTTQDSYHRAFMSNDGELFNAIHAVVNDGEMTVNTKLNPSDKGWMIEGELRGKKLSQPLNASDEPGTWLRQAREVRTLLNAEQPVGATHVIPMWLSNDPTKLTDAKLVVTKKVDATTYGSKIEMASLQIDATLDAATGTPKAAVMKVGNVALELTRVHQSGKF